MAWPDIELTRGDTLREYLKLFDEYMDPLDLAGCTVWFTVKPGVDNDPHDSAAYFQHFLEVADNGTISSADGFSIGGVDPQTGQIAKRAAQGVLTHFVSHQDSNQLPIGNLVYDIQVMAANGEVKTIIQNASLTVTGDVTRRTVVR